MKIFFSIILVVFFVFLFIFVLVSAVEPNEAFGYSKGDKRFNIFKWGCRLLLLLIVVGCIFMNKKITDNNNDFNERAKICGIGCYDSVDKVSLILDSLCNHNCVKFGEIYHTREDLSDIYLGRKCPNGYVVGCRDTVTGDRLEIKFSVYISDTYSPVEETWESSYETNISQISLTNCRGITKSNVSIADYYLAGGKGYDNGYRTLLNDTCAILYRKR